MTSKYQTIVNDIVTAIENHHYKRGQKLPSIRQLSQSYQCSKDTVQKAMVELKYQNKIYAVEKSGYYILEDQDFKEKTVELDPADFQKLPYEDFRVCLHESLVGRENYLFNYYHQQEGLAELIDAIQSLLMDYHVYTKKDQLAITAGSQQALYILTQMAFDAEKTDILIESPTYSRMLELVRHQAIPYQTIERTLDGIDLNELERIFKTGQIKFFYTIPRLHNPLGSSYSLASKKALIQLAQQYQVYIIEDDYLADFDEQKSLPLHYLDADNRVIYIKSFTPTLFPALRIGAISLPQNLVADFLQHKSLIDYDTNLIMQKALALYIDNGMFSRNTHDLQQIYHRQQEEMKKAAEPIPSSLPYAIGIDRLTFQVEKASIRSTIGQSIPGTTLFKGLSVDYLQIQYSSHFMETLKKVLDLLMETR